MNYMLYWSAQGVNLEYDELKQIFHDEVKPVLLEYEPDNEQPLFLFNFSVRREETLIMLRLLLPDSVTIMSVNDFQDKEFKGYA